MVCPASMFDAAPIYRLGLVVIVAAGSGIPRQREAVIATIVEIGDGGFSAVTTNGIRLGCHDQVVLKEAYA